MKFKIEMTIPNELSNVDRRRIISKALRDILKLTKGEIDYGSLKVSEEAVCGFWLEGDQKEGEKDGCKNNNN